MYCNRPILCLDAGGVRQPLNHYLNRFFKTNHSKEPIRRKELDFPSPADAHAHTPAHLPSVSMAPHLEMLRGENPSLHLLSSLRRGACVTPQRGGAPRRCFPALYRYRDLSIAKQCVTRTPGN